MVAARREAHECNSCGPIAALEQTMGNDADVQTNQVPTLRRARGVDADAVMASKAAADAGFGAIGYEAADPSLYAVFWGEAPQADTTGRSL
jgi:hypothetical protein